MHKDCNLNLALNCPHCRITLSHTCAGYYCERCKKEYLIENGITVLTDRNDFYYGEIDKRQMSRCLDLMKEYGFNIGLSKFFDEIPEEIRNRINFHVTNVKWNAFEPFLQIKNDTSILVLGAGWGSIAISLQAAHSHVTAMDVTKERLMALRYRLMENKIDDVRLIHGGDTKNLPFCDYQFDTVILVEMFDYIHMLPCFKSIKGKVRLFSEINRVLNPEGTLVIGVKNKFSFIRYFGKPRKDFNIDGKEKKYKIGVHLYSLKKFLNKSLFSSINIFIPKPDHREINEIIPISSLSWFRFNLKNYPLIPYYDNLIPRIFRYIVKYLKVEYFFADSYLIIASKSGAASLFNNIVNMYSKNSSQNWYINKIKISYTGRYLLFSLISTKNQRAVGKLPLYPIGNQLYLKANVIKKALLANDRLPSSIKKLIPQTLATYPYKNTIVVIEEFFNGFSPCPSEKNQPWFFEMLDFIFTINKTTKINLVKKDQVINDLLLFFLPQMKKIGIYDTVMPFVDNSCRVIADNDFFFSFAHGDLCHGNLMVNKKNELKGVLDWEFCFSEHIGVFDVIYFLKTLRCFRLKVDYYNSIFTYEDFDTFLSLKEKESIKQYFNELHFPLSNKTWGAVQVLIWMHQIFLETNEWFVMDSYLRDRLITLSSNRLKEIFSFDTKDFKYACRRNSY